MKSINSYIQEGVQFVKNNPQLLYTLALLVLIPLAFVFTSQQFLGIAQDQNDRVEQSRIGLLGDTMASFLPSVADNNVVDAHIAAIAAKNENITGFYVVFAQDADPASPLSVIASLNKNEVPLGTFNPDPMTGPLIKLALVDPGTPYTTEYTKDGARAWKTVYAVHNPRPGIAYAYIVADVAMSQSDAVLAKNIREAYVLLAAVVLLIVILLGRQARIVDYATLYRKLEGVDKMKDDFVSMAAHELRSPLTTIRGYADLLREAQHMSPQGEEMLGHIDRSAQDLNALIGDILDVSKLQEGRMSFAYTTMDPIAEVRAVVEDFRKPANEKGLEIALVPGEAAQITVDKTRLHQVLVNFVGNAVKYTPKGGVTVTTKVLADRQLYEIRVSDTGLGISAEAQEKLFTKFFRVKTEETAKITGTGLGLWITAEIVRQMHGAITVESIEGKGSDFIVRFPLV